MRKNKEDAGGTKYQQRQRQGHHTNKIRRNQLSSQTHCLALITDSLRDQDEHSQGHEKSHRHEDGRPVEARPPQDHSRADGQGDRGSIPRENCPFRLQARIIVQGVMSHDGLIK